MQSEGGPFKIRAKGSSSGSPIATAKEEAAMLWSWFLNHLLAAFHSTVAVHAMLLLLLLFFAVYNFDRMMKLDQRYKLVLHPVGLQGIARLALHVLLHCPWMLCRRPHQ